MADHSGTRHRKAVTYCVDARGLPYALFSAHQVALLNRENRDFDILICGTEELAIPGFFADLGISFRQIDLPSISEHSQIKSSDHITNEAYMRLWLPLVLSGQYDRILYLDFDTYVLSNTLSDLMDANLGGHAIGAVRDRMQWRVRRNQPVDVFQESGQKGIKYLNSGVILFDCAEFANRELLGQILGFAQQDRYFQYHDQSILNLVLCGEWAELHPVWNWQIQGGYPGFEKHFCPQIIHFTGPEKPWTNEKAQARQTLRIANEYKMFLETHFPDQTFPQADANAIRGGIWPAILDLIDHLHKLPRIYMTTRGFKSDLDVLH